MTPAAKHRVWTATGAVSMLGVAAAVAAIGAATGGRRPGDLEAIAFAAGVCLVGGISGWLVERSRPADPGQAVARGLGAVCLRVFPPLAALAWVQSAGGRLRENGGAGWLLVFYLAVLAADILLHVVGSCGDRRRRETPEN